MPRKKASKKRRASFLKIKKGRGKGATWYIVDTYPPEDVVLHPDIESLREAQRSLRELKAEDEYSGWVS